MQNKDDSFDPTVEEESRPDPIHVETMDESATLPTSLDGGKKIGRPEATEADEPKLYWRGKPIDDLTKEQLVDALHWAASRIQMLHIRHTRDIESLASLTATTKKGGK